jgi:myotubularin-related protein 3/4
MCVQVLWPACNVRDLVLWSKVYLGVVETNLSQSPSTGASVQQGPGAAVLNGDCAVAHHSGPVSSSAPVGKTRSYDDLLAAAEHATQMHRRSSDPSIVLDTYVFAMSDLHATE